MGPSTSVDGEVQGVLGGRVVPGASMGPSTSVDGELILIEAADTLFERLQWGRRQASTERSTRIEITYLALKLQWGRRQASTESAQAGAMGAQVAALQWGRRQASTESLAVTWRFRPLHDASMGPSTSVDGE